ncbi:MAG: tetratricopeptide repeat protein [Comamonadaceae bacterium]|nr:tetratricopeptide repeat protein [Comamonadaceae bacterium]
MQFDKGQADAAKASLAWVADNAVEDEYAHRRPPAPGRRCWPTPSSTTRR